MRAKDSTVQCIFHPVITAFLFGINILYTSWGDELVITSGSEPETRHSYTSLHYATPCQAADIRTHQRAHVPSVHHQAIALREAADLYCDELGIPRDWIEIIVEHAGEDNEHIHIEYQPKRIYSL